MPVPRITKEALKQRLEAGDPAARPAIVDVRLKYAYEHSTVTLPGAIRMMASAIDTARLPKGRDLVVYDSDPNEITGSEAAVELIGLGYTVAVLEGGIAGWAGANFPMDTKSAPKATPPPAKA
jgi:rhodanese-related sulfurtransferase